MNILFVCTGNTCRSPMAKILLEKMADERGLYVNVKSRGIMANSQDGISRGTYAVLLKEGIDSSYHKARSLEEKDIEEADKLFTMTQTQALSLKARYPNYAEKIEPISNKDVIDPFGGSLQDYENTLESMKSILEDVLDKIEGEKL